MVVIAIAIGACSVDLGEARTIQNDGVAMLEDGEWEDAAAAFSQVIDLEPSDTDLLAKAYLNRSFANAVLERWEESVADASVAVIDLDPSDTVLVARAYLNRSVALGALGRWEEALADATTVIDLEPGDAVLARGYFFRAVALAELGRTDEAAADAQTALGLLPPTHDVSRGASELLVELGFSE